MTTPFLKDAGALLVAAAPTRFGHVGVAVIDDRIAGISIGHRSDADAAARLQRTQAGAVPATDTASSPDEQLLIGTLDRIVEFMAGAEDSFSDVPLALDHLTTFQRRVVAACRRIAPGATRSYGQLAATAGSPGAARAVGQVMASNRYPIVVPCHRVVGAGGRLGGFSAPQGVELKRQLLAFEAGVADNGLSSPSAPARSRKLAAM